MSDFKSGFNPFSSENSEIFLYTLIGLGIVLIIMVLVDRFRIPQLHPNNKFRLWWEKHIISLNPFEK